MLIDIKWVSFVRIHLKVKLFTISLNIVEYKSIFMTLQPLIFPVKTDGLFRLYDF